MAGFEDLAKFRKYVKDVAEPAQNHGYTQQNENSPEYIAALQTVNIFDWETSASFDCALREYHRPDGGAQPAPVDPA